MDFNKFNCWDVVINTMPSGMGERDDLLSSVMLRDAFSNIRIHGIQTAKIYLGNPFDTGYVDEMVGAVYLGTTFTRFNLVHCWLYYNHNGEVCICKTLNSDCLEEGKNYYPHASRTTEARSLSHWSKAEQEKAEELLGYAGIRPHYKKAA